MSDRMRIDPRKVNLGVGGKDAVPWNASSLGGEVGVGGAEI